MVSVTAETGRSYKHAVERFLVHMNKEALPTSRLLLDHLAVRYFDDMYVESRSSSSGNLLLAALRFESPTLSGRGVSSFRDRFAR